MILIEYAPFLLRGLGLTVFITLASSALAVAIAFPAGLARRAPWWPVRSLATVYVEVFRGTSALVQLFWFYFALPLLGIHFSALAAGILVLGLNIGAYGAEVVRGAVQAVPPGQLEAAKALNFTPWQRLRLVVVPQALPAMLPPWGNLFIELLKGTALVSLITLHELTFQAQVIRDETLRTAEVYFAVLVLYFLVAQAIAAGVRVFERRLWAARGENPRHV